MRMAFGKYRSRDVRWVASNDPDYLRSAIKAGLGTESVRNEARRILSGTIAQVPTAPPLPVAFLHPTRLVPGDEIPIRFIFDTPASGIDGVQVQIFAIRRLDTSWQGTSHQLFHDSSDPYSRSACFTSALTAGFEPGVPLEIRHLQLRSGEQVVRDLIGGKDFPRAFIEVLSPAGERVNEDPIETQALTIEADRDVWTARPLGDPNQQGANDYQVVCVVENLLMTTHLRMPGIQITPLSPGNPSRTEFDIVASCLRNLKLPLAIDPAEWAAQSTRGRPLLLIHFPHVWATSDSAALELASTTRERLLAVLTLTRGSSGRTIASVVYTARGEPRGWQAGFEPYRGNLAGGFISGESIDMVLGYLDAATKDPLLDLWVSLAREASSERNRHFAYARYWHLLEVIAARRIPNGLAIADLDGTPHLSRSGQPVVTSDYGAGPHARVYQLLRTVVYQDGRAGWAAIRPSETLWDQVNVWSAFRNAALHHGGFELGDPAQMAQPWYEHARQAFEFVQTAPAGPDGADPYLWWLKEAAALTLDRELMAAGTPGPSPTVR